ncbi:MAG: hypothetical protein ACREB3_13645, partial [Burkholderiales bacterium]
PTLWASESEIRSIEDHLVTCPNCQSLKLELTEIKTAARELPMHTPPRAMWTRISNVVEAELPLSERPTRDEALETSWWERMKARKFSFNLPQLAGAGSMALALIVLGMVFTRPAPAPLNFSGAQMALLPEESPLKAEIERRLAAIESRKAKWDPQVRAEFEQHIAKIEESLKLCREKLRVDPLDAVHRNTLHELYTEERQLLEDVERLKW